MFTGLLENHYQIKLPHAVPARMVALMMAAVKLNRDAFRFKQDNHDDAKNYLDIAKEVS